MPCPASWSTRSRQWTPTGVVAGTPDRAALRVVQTPQGFGGRLLVAAYRTVRAVTDDAALVELAGHHVVVVEGDPLAFKVTTPDDLEHAERVLAERAGSTPGRLPD